MALKTFKPVTPSSRELVLVDRSELWKGGPLKKLVEGKSRMGGRNAHGHITVRHKGGGHKKLYRIVDFKRRKFDVDGIVERLEYDPNRTAWLALIKYSDGEHAYILAPQRLAVGDKVVAGFALLRLASGETRRVMADCLATVGAVSNPDHANQNLGKAGRTRWKGIRPTVRGIAMNPVDHPHGGGEGRTKGGRHPVSPWGTPTKGYKTRKNKRTDHLIVRRRNAK